MARADRDVLINPGMRYLRRIGGLSEALAGMTGVAKGAIASERAYLAAAAAVREGVEAGATAAGPVRLVVERVRNPHVAAHRRTLGRIRAEAFRAGYDEAGLDALVAESRAGGEARQRLDAIAEAACGAARDGPGHARRLVANRLTAWLRRDGVAPSTLTAGTTSDAIDDMMHRTYLDEPRANREFRARHRYALAGDEAERAASAATIAGHVGTFKGRLPGVVSDARVKDLEAVGVAGGVRRDVARKPWSPDPAVHAAMAACLDRRVAMGWRTTRGGPDDGFAIALTRVGDDGGPILHGLVVDRDGSMRHLLTPLDRDRVVGDLWSGPTDVPADANDARRLVAVGREAPWPTGTRPWGSLEMDAFRAGADGRVTAFGHAADRAGHAFASLELARFRAEAPEEANLLYARCRTRNRAPKAWNGSRPPAAAHDSHVAVHEYALLATAQGRGRLLRAVETAPVLAATVLRGVEDIANSVSVDYAAWRGGALAARTVKSHQRAAAIVIDLAEGGSPFDAVARVAQGAMEQHGGAERRKAAWGDEERPSRRVARMLACLGPSDPKGLACAASTLTGMVAARPGLQAPRPSEVAAIARNRLLTHDALPVGADLRSAFVEAFRKPGRHGDLIARPSDDVADTVLACRDSLRRIGLRRDDVDVALTRALAPRGRNMNGLARIAAQWHADGHARTAGRHALLKAIVAEETGRPDSESAGFPAPAIAPSADVTGVPTVSVEQIRSTTGMVEEGERMHHCVGSYAGSAESGALLVFHLEGPEGPSTAGFNVYDDERGLRLVQSQHTGVHNAAVPRANDAAMKAYVAHLHATQSWREAFRADAMAARVAARKTADIERSLPEPQRDRLREYDFASLAPFLSRDDVALGRQGYVAAIAGEADGRRRRLAAAREEAARAAGGAEPARRDETERREEPARQVPVQRRGFHARDHGF